MNVRDVREQLWRRLAAGCVVEGEDSERDTIELLGATFDADEPAIFGKVNQDYVRREIAWYESGSDDVNDMEPPVPEIWRRVATPDGFVNSNYGRLIYSPAHGFQYKRCLEALLKDATCSSRQATMVYTWPNIHDDATRGGMSDFVCTDAVHCFLRDDHGGGQPATLHYVVFMRSNDAVFGYKNDLAWHKHVRRKLITDFAAHTGVELGVVPIRWSAASLHVYRRHFHLVDKWARLQAEGREA